jgi:GTP diphosphokinase / guanosine-3',5'-bis(diphosphate) 3'-diphosphatase
VEELAEPAKPDGQLEELLSRVRSYNPHVDEGLIRRAYDYADRMHHGQKRMSGEPYVIHPLNVSLIIAQLKLDPPSIVTGLLHDIVEDTNVPLAEIQNLFGPSPRFRKSPSKAARRSRPRISAR